MGKAKNTAKPKPAATAKKASTGKAATTAKKKSTARKSAGTGVSVERRTAGDRRKLPDRRKRGQPVAVERRKVQRRVKVNRRRQIDPTTCERDYTPDEIEFMNAMDDYKHVSGRMFPTCSEVLEVIKKLGYQKHPKSEGNQPLSGLSAGHGPETTAV